MKSQVLTLSLLFILGLVLFYPSQLPGSSAAGLATYTSPLPLTWGYNYTSTLHIDTPPSPFTFYPNATISLAESSTFTSLHLAIIPLQTPTSFQANNTYVSYSMRGPAQCVVAVSFQQEYQNGLPTNIALFGMSGTSSNPCASATFSIKLSSLGVVQAYNSSGITWPTYLNGTTTLNTEGIACQVKLNEIDWNWCNAVLTNVALTYNAGTLQIKNSASNWSFKDPLAIDGSAESTSNSGSITVNLSTSSSPDLLVCVISANEIYTDLTGISATGYTFYRLGFENGGGGSVQVYYTNASSTVTSLAIKTTDSAGRWYLMCFGTSGANIGATPSQSWDAHSGLPAVNQSTSSETPSTTGVSTTGTTDMVIAAFGNNAVTTQTAGTVAGNTANLINAANDGSGVSGAAEYYVISSALSSSKVTFGTNSKFAMLTDGILASSSGPSTHTLTYTANYVYSVNQALTGKLTDSTNYGYAATYVSNLKLVYSANFAYAVGNYVLTGIMNEAPSYLYSALYSLVTTGVTSTLSEMVNYGYSVGYSLTSIINSIVDYGYSVGSYFQTVGIFYSVLYHYSVAYTVWCTILPTTCGSGSGSIVDTTLYGGDGAASIVAAIVVIMIIGMALAFRKNRVPH